MAGFRTRNGPICLINFVEGEISWKEFFIKTECKESLRKDIVSLKNLPLLIIHENNKEAFFSSNGSNFF